MSRKTDTDYMPARKEPDTSTYPGRFAVRLRTLREKAELTPDQVADNMGVALSTVYSWESASTFPKTEQLLLLANVLGLKSVKALFPDR